MKCFTGDGTFLHIASHIDGLKPLIGFNTDPERSHGYVKPPQRGHTGTLNHLRERGHTGTLNHLGQRGHPGNLIKKYVNSRVKLQIAATYCPYR